MSHHHLHLFGRAIYQGGLSIRGQIRVVDVLVSIFFALLWCALGASFMWTDRIGMGAGLTIAQQGPMAWLILISTLVGGLVAAGVLGLYLYLEKWNSEYYR